jgi:hypothetical protein
MNHKLSTLVGGCILAAGLAGQSGLANAGSDFTIKGRTSGHCKLANVDAGKELYNGNCTIKEKIDGSSILYDIKMGSAESFLFATSDGVHWMHGPEEVKFRDRGDSGVFKWGDFRLEVHED